MQTPQSKCGGYKNVLLLLQNSSTMLSNHQLFLEFVRSKFINVVCRLSKLSKLQFSESMLK